MSSETWIKLLDYIWITYGNGDDFGLFYWWKSLVLQMSDWCLFLITIKIINNNNNKNSCTNYIWTQQKTLKSFIKLCCSFDKQSNIREHFHRKIFDQSERWWSWKTRLILFFFLFFVHETLTDIISWMYYQKSELKENEKDDMTLQ